MSPVAIDESRLAERPPGISEQQWRAKLTYEAVAAQHAADPETHATRDDNDDAQRAAAEVLGQPAPPARRRGPTPDAIANQTEERG